MRTWLGWRRQLRRVAESLPSDALDLALVVGVAVAWAAIVVVSVAVVWR